MNYLEKRSSADELIHKKSGQANHCYAAVDNFSQRRPYKGELAISIAIVGRWEDAFGGNFASKSRSNGGSGG